MATLFRSCSLSLFLRIFQIKSPKKLRFFFSSFLIGTFGIFSHATFHSRPFSDWKYRSEKRRFERQHLLHKSELIKVDMFHSRRPGRLSGRFCDVTFWIFTGLTGRQNKTRALRGDQLIKINQNKPKGAPHLWSTTRHRLISETDYLSWSENRMSKRQYLLQRSYLASTNMFQSRRPGRLSGGFCDVTFWIFNGLTGSQNKSRARSLFSK